MSKTEWWEALASTVIPAHIFTKGENFEEYLGLGD